MNIHKPLQSTNLGEKDAPPEPGYAVWKRAKIERGLEESINRDAMIPEARVWQDLGLEG